MRQSVLQLAKNARAAATLEQFGATLAQFPDGSGTHDEVTAFVREQTQLYRETWILGPLDEAIERLEARQEKRKTARQERKAKAKPKKKK